MAIEEKPCTNEVEYFARRVAELMKERRCMWLDKGELEMIEEFDRSGSGFMGSLPGFRR